MTSAQVTPWSVAEVLALAPDARAGGAARRIAVPTDWAGLGHDDSALWGLYRAGSAAEPYEVTAAFAEPAFRCTCPSRQHPCKHALALLLLWSAGHVPPASTQPGPVRVWLERLAQAAPGPAPVPAPVTTQPRTTGSASPDGSPAGSSHRDAGRDRRTERVRRGLVDLDRWLADAVRGGLTAPALARYATWDEVAARLVDAQAPALANRVRRLAGAVGTRPGWHEHVLAEMGALHLLCEAGRRLPALDGDLADSVRTALGWTVRQADVLATLPETDRWLVCGRSDTLEDRIVVRRLWLRGVTSARWCLLLSFAAYGQHLADQSSVGDVLHADIHRYPGRSELRCVLGTMHDVTLSAVGAPLSSSMRGATHEIGTALAAVPWTERWPVTVDAAPTLDAKRWVLTDGAGSLPLAPLAVDVATLVALTRGETAPITCEWTAAGLVPLTVHLPDRAVDLGPRGGFHERPWPRARR